jgi:cytochrome P450
MVRSIKVHDELWEIVKREVLENEEEGNTGLVGALFDLHHSERSVVDEDDIKMTFIDIVIAGTGTTSIVFFAFFNILVHYPDVQAKLQEEVDRVVGSERQVLIGDRNSMPYTQAMVLELLRYITPVSLGIPHSTLENASVCGFSVPAGTQVLANLWALHHDEAFWGDPYAFRPERFLDDDGDLVSASHEKCRHFMPFGAGVRVCLGEVLALSRIFLIISTMAQVFDVHPGKLRSSCDPRTYLPGAVLYPPDFEVMLKNRNEVKGPSNL